MCQSVICCRVFYTFQRSRYLYYYYTFVYLMCLYYIIVLEGFHFKLKRGKFESIKGVWTKCVFFIWTFFSPSSKRELLLLLDRGAVKTWTEFLMKNIGRRFLCVCAVCCPFWPAQHRCVPAFSLSFIYVIKLDKIARIGYITTSCVRYSLYIAPAAAAAANITHTQKKSKKERKQNHTWAFFLLLLLEILYILLFIPRASGYFLIYIFSAWDIQGAVCCVITYCYLRRTAASNSAFGLLSK